MRGSPPPRQENAKHTTSILDEETIKNIGRYYKVDEKNFESLLRYIKNRGLLDNAA